MLPRRFAAIAVLVVAFASFAPAPAQVKYPKTPDQYDVQIRYQIEADRIQRFKQFDEMTGFFRSVGFVQLETEESETDAENPRANRMAGTIPSGKARDLLRERHVRTILLSPAGFKIPQGKDERVKIRLELEKSLPAREQQLLHGQVVRLITEKLGYQNGISYDHQGYTVLRGTIEPVNISQLLLDLRTIPNGWFVSETPQTELPQPLFNTLAIRVIEVLGEAGNPAVPPQGLPKLASSPEVVQKLSADLQRQLAVAPDQPTRVELLISSSGVTADDEQRRLVISRLADIQIEGRLGNVYSLLLNRLDDALKLAAFPDVTAIRLPRAARPSLAPPAVPTVPKEKEKEPDPKEKLTRISYLQNPAKNAVQESGLNRLHALGKRGQGVRLVLIDTEFNDYDKFVGKELPKKTKLIDLTAGKRSTILPDPTATPQGQIGHGTHCALAVAIAAPEVDLTLVRVDPAAPYQLEAVLRFILGEATPPLSFELRRREFNLDLVNLQARNVKAIEDYRKAFDRFEDTPEADAERKKAQQALKNLEAEELLLLQRINRMQKLEADLVGLKGSDLVVSSLVWDSGHAFDGNGHLSRLIDDQLTNSYPVISRRKPGPQAKLPLWFNAVGDGRGQSWLGEFRDVDGNGIMEFTAAATKLMPDRWTRELNFLQFESHTGESTLNLPAGARVRITMQWREPHDPDLSEADYRLPATMLNLSLVKQRDPNGETAASDEVDVVALDEGEAIRLAKEKAFGIYEKTLEINVAADGRYALRVDGTVPKSNRPRGTPFLPANEIQFDLTPRFFIEVLDDSTRAKGRVVFQDFNTLLGGVSMPADARQVLSVGSATLTRQPRGYSSIGGGPSMQIVQKPDIWSFDELPLPNGPARGTALSTSFAGGMAASMLSAGAGHSDFLDSVEIKRRQILEVTEGWLGRIKK